jgi:hypothetical protein
LTASFANPTRTQAIIIAKLPQLGKGGLPYLAEQAPCDLSTLVKPWGFDASALQNAKNIHDII